MSWYVYLLAYYIKSRFFNIKKPILAGIKVTHACNLKCRHCPFWEKDNKYLSFSDVKSSFEKLHDLGVRIVIIEGGEPFLWKDGEHDIRDVVTEAKKLFFSVGITTNGTFPLDADADVIWVSLDGLKETHDSIRGKSFDRAIQNIKSSSHKNIYAHITFNKINQNDVKEIVEYLSGKVKGITVQFHYPYNDQKDALLLSPVERNIILDTLIEMKKGGAPIANSTACLLALKENTWKCRSWMIASIDPDGTLTHGCYVKGRGDISCEECGFSAHTEISIAYSGNIESILLGKKIFFPSRS
ncbi:radical SAM protein [Spirochaetota bacterium]